MASPFLQPQWSVEEAVLLVQASDNIASRGGDVNTEVLKLSKRLRSGAISMGLSINHRYRNEEEILRNLKAINTMIKMVGSVEDDYFDCSTLGKAAISFIKDKDYYYLLLDSANEKYPVVKEFDAMPEEIVVVAEPKGEYRVERKRRPRISSYHITTAIATKTPDLRSESPDNLCASVDQSTPQINQLPLTEKSHDTESVIESKQTELTREKPRPLSNYEVYLNHIRQVLIQNFPRGYRLGSAIELKRFRMAFKALQVRICLNIP